jgi:hypothetical protein
MIGVSCDKSRCKNIPIIKLHDLYMFVFIVMLNHVVQRIKPMGGGHSQTIGLDSFIALS